MAGTIARHALLKNTPPCFHAAGHPALAVTAEMGRDKQSRNDKQNGSGTVLNTVLDTAFATALDAAWDAVLETGHSTVWEPVLDTAFDAELESVLDNVLDTVPLSHLLQFFNKGRSVEL